MSVLLGVLKTFKINCLSFYAFISPTQFPLMCILYVYTLQ